MGDLKCQLSRLYLFQQLMSVLMSFSNDELDTDTESKGEIISEAEEEILEES